jgi:hypothetical protein
MTLEIILVHTISYSITLILLLDKAASRFYS